MLRKESLPITTAVDTTENLEPITILTELPDIQDNYIVVEMEKNSQKNNPSHETKVSNSINETPASIAIPIQPLGQASELILEGKSKIMAHPSLLKKDGPYPLNTPRATEEEQIEVIGNQKKADCCKPISSCPSSAFFVVKKAAKSCSAGIIKLIENCQAQQVNPKKKA